jgi:hypothetical protein
MKTPSLSTLVLGLFVPALASCGGDDGGGGGTNARQVWLGLNGSETQVQLVETEPPAY